MSTKHWFLTLCLLSVSTFGWSQSIYERFYKALNKDDSIATLLIQEIRKTNDNSPDRYIAEYNYYISMSEQSYIEIKQGENPLSEFVITDDSTGNEVGYLQEIQVYNQEYADSGLCVITKAIELFPTRLDLRFGKIHFLGQLERWDDYTNEIVKTLNYQKTNKPQWVFPDVEEDNDTLMIYSILDYETALVYSILDDNDTISFNHKTTLLRKIAEHMLELYPTDIRTLNIMAVTYQLTDEKAQALKWLKKAEKVNPKDYIILVNIADTYAKLGNIKQAKKYYKKAIKYGDYDTKKYAEESLDSLGK